MISFIIPIRNEYPHPLYTTYSHMNSLQDDDFEVLWMINAPNKEMLDWLKWVKNGEGRLSVRDLFRSYTNCRSSEDYEILKRALTLPDLDPDFHPNIHKRLSAFKG